MAKWKYITTPIFYVNSSPHLGHLYSGILADACTRWYRQNSFNVLFTTGVDEHGQKIQTSAEKRGISPQHYCDFYASHFKELFEISDVEFDCFYRTSSVEHYAAVAEFWKTLQKQDLIYMENHSGWYCQAEERFVPASQLSEDLKTNSGYPVEWVSEKNYKFRLSSVKQDIKSWLETVALRNSTRAQCLQELENTWDFSISRSSSRVHWGINVPGDDSQVVYVWLDALTNYLATAGYPHTNLQNSHIWKNTVHIIGKDIARFHCIYWPGFLIGAELPLPKEIVVHDHWLVQNAKMSKSLGNSVDPFKILQKFGCDNIRFYMLLHGPQDSDSSFCQKTLVKSVNSVLRDRIGNLVLRATSKKILNNFNASEVPFAAAEEKFMLECEHLIHQVKAHYDKHEFSEGLRKLVCLIDTTNSFFQKTEPWKDPSSKSSSVFLTFEACRIALQLLLPVTPMLSQSLLSYLNADPLSPLEFRKTNSLPILVNHDNQDLVKLPKLNLTT